MKTNILLVLFVAFNILSCNKDSIDDDNESFTFKVEVQNVTDRNATITWSRPEGSNITYKIYLNDELIEDNFVQTAYTFTGLLDETSYNGKISATDGSQTATMDFTFETQIFSPKIFIGNVFLCTQEEIDLFGSEQYNIIEGSLEIDGCIGSNITNLSVLNHLTKITQGLKIKDIYSENLEGLENLNFIGGNLLIWENNMLINLDALSGLETIENGGVSIYSNNSLININIFNNIQLLKFWNIYENNSLQTIQGFQNLSTVSTDVWLEQNPALIECTALNSITTIGENIQIAGNSLLNQLKLDSLTTVNNFLYIYNNGSLSNLEGMNNLIYVGNQLGIFENGSLSDFCALSQIILNQGYGSLGIGDNLYNPTVQDFINGDCSL